ncbi:MAG: flagellar M-ring protein FliF [Candidatus Handelsmanbacteria bacterium RIFCSPLOWO2_12_FULL_64_10]|uniref:Flagellar M-ring protein n=1 Tax=Handelsmanbacteria sp. (strain RIFCSPLOWO2_12_FULL_64_10) TaxID=1817868 RepID=A0A1F6D5Z0_HANXR|nr:MAG: flagellar M-ring protein FliF [Candidatus Handelsmanbacteria bacterium RIFCSPLOWO2_12_FULL_64_10]
MENLRVYIDKLMAFWNGLGRTQKIAAAAGAGVFLLLLLFFSFRGEEKVVYAPLYTDLEPAEAGQVVMRLRQMNEPYQILGGGAIVMASEKRVDDLRVALAAEGLPQSGLIGYKLFDEAKLGMTEFLQKVNNQRAMQDEIAKTLSKIQWIQGTPRVQLSIPEPSLFTEQEKPVTASIMLPIRRGFRPEHNQVQGVALLVARAVPGLQENNVTIVDNTGRLLTEEADPLARQASKQMDLQRNVEAYLEKKAASVLEKITGRPDNFSVKVSVALDFNQAEQTMETYDPNATVLRSEERNEESSAEAGTKERTVSNYEINKTISKVVSAPGVIKRRSVSVTLDRPIDPQTSLPAPRPQTEVDNIRATIMAAVGYNASADQFEIRELAFDRTARAREEDAQRAAERSQLITDIVLNVAKGVAIIIALLVLRAIIGAIGRGVAREEEIAAAAVEGVAQEAAAEIMPETPHEITLGRIAQMISERPEDAARLIRTMLLEEAQKQRTQ